MRGTGTSVVGQRAHHAVLAVDRVRRGQELPGRLLPQHVALAAGEEKKGRVRLPALELAHRERSARTLDMRAHVASSAATSKRCAAPDLAGLVLDDRAALGHAESLPAGARG